MDENNKIKIDNDAPKAIRTYTSDMVQVIRDNEISVAKIAAREKEKEEDEELYESGNTTKGGKIFFMIIGLLLLIIAIVAVYFVNNQAKKKNIITPPTTTKIDTFISYDEMNNIDVTNINDKEEFATLLNSKNNKAENKIKATVLTKNENTENKNITINELFDIVGNTAPMSLIRSLDNKYLLGEYTHNNITSRYLIFKTNDYNQTYASMLEWEKSMPSDYYELFNNRTNQTELEKSWKDLVIDNRDARVLYKTDGEAFLYYLFINKDELIITNNLDLLKIIVDRIIIKK